MLLPLFESDPEREQRYLCQLEALESEGNSDDGDAIDAADYQICQGKFPSEEDYPEDISQEAADAGFVIGDLFAEWPEGKSRELEALYTEGNSDYGNAADDTCNKPQDS